MRIWIMRHGQAESMHVPDAERALTARGLEQAVASGQWLVGQGAQGVRIVASPYRRAQQTAVQVAAQLGVASVESLALLQPEGDPRRVSQWLAQQPDQSLVLVSHMPLVAQLVSWLEDGVLGGGIPFGTAEVRVLECDEVVPGFAAMVGRRGGHD